MHRDTVLKAAKAKIKNEFGSVTEAAEYFDVDRATLSIFLSNHKRIKDKDIPQYILDYMGLDKITVTTYHKKRG